MTVALLVITDGREDYLPECVESARQLLVGPIGEWWMYDDTGDDSYRAKLRRRYADFRHINGGSRQGFAGAIRRSWSHLNVMSQARYVFHLEQDFVFRRDVPLVDMMTVLDANPHLVQLALRRQPWNDVERAAGGIVESRPDEYADCADDEGRQWLEHRLFFTTNPSLYRRTLCLGGWPLAPNSEGKFSERVRRHGTVEASGERARFGFWGSRESGEWVEHIGHVRAGNGY